MSERLANGSGMAAIVIWCMTPAMLALTGNMPPFLLGAVSFLAAFAVALGWWVARGESLRDKFIMPWQAWALGIGGFGLYNFLYIYSFKVGPTLEVNLLNYVWPACLIVTNCLLLRRAPDSYALGGIFFCLVGVFFVFSSRGMLSFSHDWLMMAAGVGCGVLWGVYSALSKVVPETRGRIPVFFLFTGLVMLGFHLAFEKTIWPQTGFAWIMLGGHTAGRIAFLLWDYAMKQGQARLIGSVSYFIPFFATVLLVAAGYGRFDMRLLVGGGLIIFGSITINLPMILRSLRPVQEEVVA